MSIRNVIQIKLDIEAEQIVSYEKGLEAIQQLNEVKDLNLRYLASVNQLVELLELTRAAIERNIIENHTINTGVRHLDVSGKNFPRTRIYIDALDLIDYLIKYCELTYWKREQMGPGLFQLRPYKADSLTKADTEYLAQTLIEGRLKSSKQIEGEYNRTRRIVSRLSNIIETISFAFPGSQRNLKRFIFAPSDDTEQIEDYFSRYKVYENMVTKVNQD